MPEICLSVVCDDQLFDADEQEGFLTLPEIFLVVVGRFTLSLQDDMFDLISLL